MRRMNQKADQIQAREAFDVDELVHVCSCWWLCWCWSLTYFNQQVLNIWDMVVSSYLCSHGQMVDLCFWSLEIVFRHAVYKLFFETQLCCNCVVADWFKSHLGEAARSDWIMWVPGMQMDQLFPLYQTERQSTLQQKMIYHGHTHISQMIKNWISLQSSKQSQKLHGQTCIYTDT